MIVRMIASVACLAVLGCLLVGTALSILNLWWAALIPVVVGVGVLAAPGANDERNDPYPKQRW